MTDRYHAGTAIAFALIGGVLLAVGRADYADLHTILDTGICLLSGLLALQLSAVSAGLGDRVPRLIAVSFAVTCGLYLIHTGASIEWSGPLAGIAQAEPVWRPTTWSAAAYVLPIGIGSALWLMRGGRATVGWFATGLIVLAAGLCALFSWLPRYVAPDWLGIARPTLIPVPLLWALVGGTCWRWRARDRSLATLAIMAAVLFVAQVSMLYSQDPYDTQAMVAHLVTLAAYLLVLRSLMQMAAADKLERMRAELEIARWSVELEGRVRDRTTELQAANESLTAEIAVRRQAQEARHESEERARAFVESSDDAIITKTLDGTITSWNPGAERLYGHSVAEAVGQPIRMIFPPERTDEEADVLARIGRGEGLSHLETVRLRKDGSRVDVSVTISVLRDARGSVVGASTIARDITERIRAQESQLRSQKLEALGTLAGGIAHDFNNILLAVTGNAQLALGDLTADHPARESLVEISKAGARATDVVRRILTFGRPLEQKHAVLHLEPVIAEALKLLHATLPAMVEIRTQYAADLPPIAADATQLHLILVNLATNAAHAIGPRSGRLDLSLEAITVDGELASTSPELGEGRYVRLSVSDNGCGMDRATLNLVFDPFFTTKPPGVGTGLGLSVVHGIMKSHGGAVTVSSEPGRGSTFRLYFPAATGVSQTSAVAERAITRGRGERVLYVDDDEALVFLVTRLLTRLGYRVTGCANACEALQELRSRPQDFDVVVTDLSMPGMSGFDLASAVRSLRPDLPIVLTSGNVRLEDQATAQRIGIRAVIRKPDTADELGEVLGRLLSVEGDSASMGSRH